MGRKRKYTTPGLSLDNFKNIKVSKIPLSQIKPNSYNANKMDDNILKSLKESINKHGFTQPILLNKVGKDSYEIIDGEHRYMACKSLRFYSINAVVVEVPPDKQKILTLSMNKLRGYDDKILLADIFKDLKYEYNIDIDSLVEETGYKQNEIIDTMLLLSAEVAEIENRLNILDSESIVKTPRRYTTKSQKEKILEEIKQNEFILQNIPTIEFPSLIRLNESMYLIYNSSMNNTILNYINKNMLIGYLFIELPVVTSNEVSQGFYKEYLNNIFSAYKDKFFEDMSFFIESPKIYDDKQVMSQYVYDIIQMLNTYGFILKDEFPILYKNNRGYGFAHSYNKLLHFTRGYSSKVLFNCELNQMNFKDFFDFILIDNNIYKRIDGKSNTDTFCNSFKESKISDVFIKTTNVYESYKYLFSYFYSNMNNYIVEHDITDSINMIVADKLNLKYIGFTTDINIVNRAVLDFVKLCKNSNVEIVRIV